MGAITELRSDCDRVVALVGNPNVGKSTLFNVLTGETAHVGNWPGVTVELKIGSRRVNGRKICFVDLPGTYGISGTSLEEIVAREFIVSGRPDLTLVLVDATAPERTLYLAIQILELTPKVIIVFTKIDEAHPKGIHIHYDKLEEYLGVPVVPVSALKGNGIRELLESITNFDNRLKRDKPLKLNYGGLEYFINELDSLIRSKGVLKQYPPRWVAVRLLEGDARIEELLTREGDKELLARVRDVIEGARRALGRDLAELSIRQRFSFVDSLIRKVVVRTKVEGISRVEALLQRPIAGLGFSAALTFSVFLLIFSINTGFPLNIIFEAVGMKSLSEVISSYSLSGLVSSGFNLLSNIVSNALLSLGSPHWLASLISNGIILGVGSILSFFPLILMVFLFLAILEDSGLLPRMAVCFHTILSKFGLSGRAVYPLIISMGCNVPGVLTSRTSIDEVERQGLIFSVPFIPCQARLIVGLAFTMALFKSALTQALAIVFIYALGAALSLSTAVIMRRLIYKVREPPELIMELPPIHSPKIKVVWWLTWDNTKHFLRKAGLIIFSLSIIVWILLYTGPSGYLPDIYGANFFQHSFAAIIGNAVAPALYLLNLNHTQAWKMGFALVNGLIAKEVVLDSLSVLHGGANPVEAIRALGINWIQGIALMSFITLYLPCLATLAVMYQESKSAKKTLASLIYMIAIAYAVSLLTYYVLSIISSLTH